MSFSTHTLSNTLVIEAAGRITIGRGDVALRNAVQQAVDDGHRSIILDLAQVKTIDSAGTGELLAAHLLLQQLGGRLVLTRLSPKVGGVLMSTRLSGVLEIHDSIEGAALELAA